MVSAAADLARRLARDAEAVCRHYLSHGRRSGRYWLCGDVMNTPGRSLYVRLTGPDYGPGASGHWTDAANGEHGELLHLIALNRGLGSVAKAMAEARSFLALPHPAAPTGRPPPARGSPEAARRLFRAGCPVPGTPAEAYLRARGITGPLDWPALRFHPSVYCRTMEGSPLQRRPALLAAVTGLDGTITGVLRTWLDPQRAAKAPIAEPRRALGCLLGNGVRFGAVEPAPAKAGDTLAAGEGIETMLALKSVLPRLPMVAGLSANHLAALELPSTLHRLYVARDNDAAGLMAANRLHERAARTRARLRHRSPRPRAGPWRLQRRSLPPRPYGHVRASRVAARPCRSRAFPAP
ncbi:MAG TPA: toprim domain-containing protein [Stellaceae bacterium]|nr:toprim domain-containing protein [Stellaceae bacterium]